MYTVFKTSLPNIKDIPEEYRHLQEDYNNRDNYNFIKKRIVTKRYENFYREYIKNMKETSDII